MASTIQSIQSNHKNGGWVQTYNYCQQYRQYNPQLKRMTGEDLRTNPNKGSSLHGWGNCKFRLLSFQWLFQLEVKVGENPRLRRPRHFLQIPGIPRQMLPHFALWENDVYFEIGMALQRWLSIQGCNPIVTTGYNPHKLRRKAYVYWSILINIGHMHPYSHQLSGSGPKT